MMILSYPQGKKVLQQKQPKTRHSYITQGFAIDAYKKCANRVLFCQSALTGKAFILIKSTAYRLFLLAQCANASMSGLLAHFIFKSAPIEKKESEEIQAFQEVFSIGALTQMAISALLSLAHLWIECCKPLIIRASGHWRNWRIGALSYRERKDSLLRESLFC